MSITPQDDFFHPCPPDEPFWNEASWFSFMVPERDLSGFVYLYHRPNIGYTVGGIAAWEPQGSETYDCLIYDWGEAFQTPPDAEMFDFELGSGLRIELIEPLRHYRFSYRGQSAFNSGVEVNLDFVADHPPHNAGFPAGLEEWGKGHYDQPGRVTGNLKVDGEVIQVDCVAQRDRSWGIRDIVNNPRGQMIWAVGEHSSFHALAVSFRKPEDDPVLGTTEDIILGYYLRDGRYGDLIRAEGNTIAVAERDESGRPVTYRIEATDSLGRRLESTGRVRNMFNWQGYSWLTTFWSLVEWDLDDATALGEGQDYWPLHHSRSFLRSLNRKDS